MTFIRSTRNGCTYILDQNNQRVLMYHPLYKGGDMETNAGAYEYVDWDCLEGDTYDEADRCYALLLSEVQQDTPLADLYGG